MAMGHAYFEILGNITNNLFSWLLNLFDQKIFHNVPDTKPGSTGSPIDYILPPVEKMKGPIPKDVWNPALSDNLPKISLRDIYMKGSSTIDITPWYKDTTAWFWLIGSSGVIYLGYNLFFNTSFIDSFFLKDIQGHLAAGQPTVIVSNASSGANSPNIE